MLIILTIIVIGFRTVYIQEKTGEIIGEQLTKTLKHTVKVKRVQIDWFDHLILNEVSLYDYQNTRMIHLGEGIVDFRIFTLEKSLTLRIESITLKDGEVHLIKYKGADILNLNEFIDVVSSLSGQKDTSAQAKPYLVDDVKLVNMRFAFDDMRKRPMSGFDHNHFSFDSIYAVTHNLYAYADTFRIDINDLTTIEGHTRLRVHKLAGTYSLCAGYMELDHMYAHIGNSLVKDYLKFSYSDILDMQDFNTKTYIKGNLDSSFIDFKDLSYFAEPLRKYNYRVAISGSFTGTVSKFTGTKLSLNAGNSSLQGSVHMDGLPNFFSTYIDATFTKAYIDEKDLAPFLSEETGKTFSRIGYLNGFMSFNGFPKNFVANSNVKTRIGDIKTDTKFNIEQDIKTKSYYSGSVTTHNFNLGKLIQNDRIGLINMDGKIEGVGFDIDELSMKMVASIKSVEYNSYTYKNIHTDALLQKSLFNGHADIKDSNLVMVVDGMLDYRNPEKILQVKVTCDKAQLKPLHLNLYDKDLLVRTNLFIDFKGKDIDDAVGNGYITNSYLLYNGSKEIFIDTLHLESNIDGDSGRSLQLNSNIISASITGNFKPTVIAHDFIEFAQEVSNSIIDDSLILQTYYKNKSAHEEEVYNVKYDIEMHDINAFLNIYTPGLYISDNSNIKGRFTSGKTKILKARSYIDTLYYKGFEFRKNKFNLFCSQANDTSDVLGSFLWTSENQNYERFTDTENLTLETVLSGRSATFYLGAKQQKSSNHTRLSGTIDLMEPYNVINIDNSFISIEDKVWKFEDNRKIYFNATTMRFDSLSLYYKNERITAMGGSENGSTKGSLIMNDVVINDFTRLFTNYNFGGIINGVVNLGKSDVNSDVRISDFKVDTIYVGHINGNAVWNNIDKSMNIDLNVESKSNTVLDLTGYYVPGSRSQDEDLNLKAVFHEADISTLNTIAAGVFSNISGYATGELKITGTIGEPVVKGEAFVKNGRFKIPFLGTSYSFSDYIKLEDDRIGFHNLELKDVNNTICYVNGGLNHTHFSDFVLDFKGEIPRRSRRGFQALNLKEKEGSVFYGEAYVTGDWEILGAFNDIKIKANALSQSETKIYIPLSTYSQAAHQSYIQFVDSTRKSTALNAQKKIDLSGIEMEFNLEITPEAYTEIIFDKKAGDIIRGNGQGNMKLTIDTRGDFNMYGNYEITEGKYNFTMAGIINKEFTIDPGSSIQWHGDPYGGELDIDTRYRIFTSLKPILTGADSILINSPDAQRKYPVNVLMGLKGNLKNPEINLGIFIENKYPGQFTGYVTSFEATVEANPSEMNKQAFSVIVLRRLSPIGVGSVSGVNSTYANLSELLSNQLSNFLSQVDENLEINVDLTTLDRNGLNTFNMRFAYTALDGRLRISRESGYHYANTTNAATNIVGEWTVEYLLTSNGNLRAKVYNKINQNALITSTSGNATMATGFSLQHTQGFDNLADIFKKRKSKEKKRKAPKQSGIIYRNEEEQP